MTELWRLTAVEIAAMVRSRRVSAVEVARDSLARLEAVNPLINAIVEHRPADILSQAEAIDAAMARGEDPGGLAGVPVTIKVTVDQTGYATTNGIGLQRDLIARDDSPVVGSLKRSGAILIGRTNTPAFSYRWFTNNLLHGATKNPRNPALTPGGSSGGAAAATASSIGAIGHGTDIAGSIRYPAYACGIHGLRPSLGRIAAYNASSAERGIGGQMMAVSGPLARTIGDLRLGLAAMAQPDARDPWWVPAPLEGPPMPRRAVLCIRPDGLETTPAVRDALIDSAARLERAGWAVDEVENLPPLREAAALQVLLWLSDGYEDKLRDAVREGDPGALTCLRGFQTIARSTTFTSFSDALTRRATLMRQWQVFLQTNPVVLMPVCAELPFEDNLDLKGEEAFHRVWRAQMPQVGLPFMGLPGLTVSTGLVDHGAVAGKAPVGVQVVAGRYREDLCLEAGEAIEAGGVPPCPIDPRR